VAVRGPWLTSHNMELEGTSLLKALTETKSIDDVIAALEVGDINIEARDNGDEVAKYALVDACRNFHMYLNVLS
jgi:hypothetical protein